MAPIRLARPSWVSGMVLSGSNTYKINIYLGTYVKGEDRTRAMPKPKTKTGAGIGAGEGGAYRPPVTISRSDFLRDDDDTRFRESIYVLVQALGRLQVCREAFGRRLGLSASQFAVLIGTAYRQGDSGVTIRDLADHVALASTHVTTEVGRMIRLGLLVKRPNTRDRRSVLVTLTPRGERAVDEVVPFIRRVNDLLFEGITAEELEAMRGFARKLLRNGELVAALLRADEAGAAWLDRGDGANLPGQ